jgi:alkylated DNA repair dioxygenase AlkB
VGANVSWQPSLFDGGTPALDVCYDGLRRIELDERSWVDYCPGWLSGSDAVFDLLASTAQWQQRTVTMWDNTVLEPRLTAGWSTDAGLAPPLLLTMCELLSARYHVGFDRVWVNLYRDGRDSVAWHGDRIPHEIIDPIVAIVSLGERRVLRMRPKGGGPSQPFVLHGGDLFVMGGTSQRTWEHSVAKTASSGPRLSVQFRHDV